MTIPAFYTPPAALPQANGALVRTEALPLAVSLPGITGTLPGRATRLMYKSTDSNGAPVAVTGAYIEPTAAWTGNGPRPLVVVAPGTMGQGDQCSASFGLEHPVVVTPNTISVGYEILAMYRLLANGIGVVVTDYVGLGTTDRLHTYVNRVDEGHAVLDAARAARALPGTSLTPGSLIGLYGYSQGGGATAAAAELQPSYAPDVPLAGAYVGAPPADLAAVTRAIDGSALAGALGWAVNGFVQADPALRPILNGYLNAAGQAALTDLSTMCVGDAILTYGYQHSTAWTTTGQSISDIVATVPVAQAVFAKQRIGTLKPTGPVRVATGVNDNLVPHAQARTLAVDWCGLGGNVTYVPVNAPALGDALLNHFGPLLADQAPAIDWLTNRLTGQPGVSNCSTMPTQP
ncbi:MAG TPA: lipase family protein [Rugosimonospora sp.]|nr:lipase family protein [Rugosimonospora sp.]